MHASRDRMNARWRRLPGARYALTEDGVELPVVDITNPAFTCAPSDEELDGIAERSRRGLELSRRVPAFVLRLMARRSIVMRGMLDADGSFVSGLTTYLFKLGPENLPPNVGGRLDRKMLAAIGPVTCRIRLREVARQITDAAVGPLTERRGPFRLIDLGGGVAADAFNALLLVQKEHPGLLTDRAVQIVVLDVDEDGPRFGSRAVTALCEVSAPLAGLAVRFAHKIYDWADASALPAALGDPDPEAVVVVTSEGGIFEYADDDTIRSNLAVFRDSTPRDVALVGSLVRDDNLGWLVRGSGSPAVCPRGLAAFGLFVRQAGWVIETARSSPLYHVVTLKKA